MRKNLVLFKKTLVIGILILFIGTGALPAYGNINFNETSIIDKLPITKEKITTPINKDINSYLQNQYYLKNNKIPEKENNYFESNFQPRQLIIKFKTDTDIRISLSSDNYVTTGISSVDLLNEKNKVVLAEKLYKDSKIPVLSSVYKFTFQDNIDVNVLAKEYNLDPNVEYAEPNYISHFSPMSYTLKDDSHEKIQTNSNDPIIIPNDEYFDEQWSLNQSNDCDIDAPEAWTIEKGNENVVIAIVDSGVDYNHPDLSGNIWINMDEIPNNGIDDDGNGFVDDVRGWDFVDDDNTPMDTFGGGTLSSGVACAVTNNSIGIAGVCWNCKVMAVRSGDEVGFLTYENIVKGIIYAVENGADVISMSWGGYVPSDFVKDALDYASSQGVVLITSAGNDGYDIHYYPARYDNVIAVAGTNQSDNRVKFNDLTSSNYGKWVDVAAPATDILSTLNHNRYALVVGTGISVPQVSGLAGLLLSKHENYPYPAEMVRSLIRFSADEIETDEYIGTGRINAYNALMMEPFAFHLKPIDNWEDTKGTIDIEGIVWGDNLEYYILELGAGENPNTWMELLNSTTPQAGMLYSLDTTLLDEGLYSLRLQAVYTHGNMVEENLVYVNNQAEGSYEADLFVSTCFDSSTPGWGVTHFDKIQNSVDNAENGDIIFVYDGFYTEYVEIKKPLKSISLIGQNNNWTILLGNINIENTSKIVISSFKIRDLFFTKLIMMWGSSNCIIKDNFIDGYAATNCGIFISYGSSDNIVENNIIHQEGFNPSIFGYLSGISVLGSTGNFISNNTMTGWRGGIQIFSSIVVGRSFNNMIKYNVIEKNMVGAELGAFLFGLVGKNTFYKNIIRNNIESGVELDCACEFLFYKNTITGNEVGVDFWGDYSFLNTFIANNISNNEWYGVNIQDYNDGVFQNKFYYNNFIDNCIKMPNRNVWDEKTNVWYKSEGLFKGIGNYWSDYTGSDANGDGFGDTPYNVPGGDNKDRFPFMEPVDIDDVVVADFNKDLAEFSTDRSGAKLVSDYLFQWFLERFPLLQKLIQQPWFGL